MHCKRVLWYGHSRNPHPFGYPLYVVWLQLANLLIHKPGSLADEAAHLDRLNDVYRRGIDEVARLIDGVAGAAVFERVGTPVGKGCPVS